MTPGPVGAAQEFYWDQTNGTHVLATDLVVALANNSGWASLGGGTYTPLCLAWEVTASHRAYTLDYIKLSLRTHDWSAITAAELRPARPPPRCANLWRGRP